MGKRQVSTIVERYSFNVPKFETSKSATFGRGGDCKRPCADCLNKISGRCTGCSSLSKSSCPDKACPAEECEKCVVLCCRGGDRLEHAIDFMGGLEVDTKKRPSNAIDLTTTDRMTVANKPGYFFADDKVVSVPWYAIYDFIKDEVITTDIRDYFMISPHTKVCVNSYMKDDKVLVLFEKIIEGSFTNLLKSYKGVDFWHTPCFSVFDKSSSMDQLLNFKRQFWAGDLMRDAGFNVIQEILFTISDSDRVKAGPDEIIEVIKKKRIGLLSMCGQLQRGNPESGNIDFFRQIPNSCTLIGVGFPPKWRDCINTNCKCRVIHGDYRKQYRKRG